ncbi:MAG TPA: TRAP transporter TatT component family protein [Blastocatellia bacterium]|nr:TRAP transporter TatT component family protein [Blastocatellia bacterium]
MPTDDILAVIGRADELYRERARPGAVRESVMILSGARGTNERYEVQWRLARALFFLGQEAFEQASRSQLYAAGIGAGERAIALNPERVEGHFWSGVNLALFAENHGGLRGLRALRWARAELKLARKVNEAYHGAGPLRVLGRLAHKAPRWLGGSLRQSEKYYERALEIAPCNTVTLVYAAELALAKQQPARARSLLERLLSLHDDPDWQYENCRDRELARELLRRIAIA